MSRHPLISSHVQNLTYHSGPDENRRIVLHASFLVQSQEIQTALVHFSYDRQQQCQNALEVAEFVKGKAGCLKITDEKRCHLIVVRKKSTCIIKDGHPCLK